MIFYKLRPTAIIHLKQEIIFFSHSILMIQWKLLFNQNWSVGMKNKIFCNKPIKEHIKIKEFKNPLSIIIYFSNVVSLTKVTIVL